MNNFSATGAIAFGWTTFKKRPGILIGAMAVVVLLQIGLQVLSMVPALGDIASFVVSVFIGMGIVSFSLAAHDNIAGLSIHHLWAPKPFWKYLWATLLKGIIAAVPFGIALLLWLARSAGKPAEAFQSISFNVVDVTLGIITLVTLAWLTYVSVKLLFVEYLVMEKNRGGVEAIKESFKMTNGVWWNLAYLTLLIGLVNIVGALALLVGLLVSVPVSMLAMVHVYRTLSGTSSVVQPVTEPTAPITAATTY